MPKLTVLSPINHDGRLYEEGDTLEIADASQADALVNCGAAVAQKGGKSKAQKSADDAAAAAVKADAIAAAEAAVNVATAALEAAPDGEKPALQEALTRAQSALADLIA